MVSKNNIRNKMEQTANRTLHYAIRKVGVGVASVLISITLYMGTNTAKADSLPNTATDVTTTKPTTVSSSSSTQENTTADQTTESTTPIVNNSVDSNAGTQIKYQSSSKRRSNL
ncbi:YSIRK-type signal peptide-containing protein [Lactobacillus salivarius]|nr:YSIRK-type signal peptide-containing protein [Ligilactobacillus salivarius]NXZ96736.1 YSIRK-type signal peptide-containing protein [Ligilactobacillus salivarius]NYA60050.1 YSIRK-type signal peptide-containing protein [Ligilactobacillus salivarius]NYA61754.1 YSIRK-type signal peptide-containing protein [Ligilactobacillus salivarius]NYA66673.1 YSIRK-type signal peptide-containing protein [Ligilactobacillus salivarius]NYA68164.1 YSIRK-type signal peptide-containing protein [Ligilactobacillus s